MPRRNIIEEYLKVCGKMELKSVYLDAKNLIPLFFMMHILMNFLKVYFLQISNCLQWKNFEL